ncbi:E3 ubiquitin-protein ligase TRIM36-like [Haliotis cracherodii]|uniref:E3 ubiquitin-protein ligase TRIM36-like n=1 Tax=Haliotis cracherodii TaxID=6455 RepID=UPI0039E72E60
MASKEQLMEEFLTCMVCAEVFLEPVTLHCGHTFCTKCVTSFTLTQKDAMGQKCLPCPHCRGLTQVPNPHEPEEEWAGQLKTGFFVKNLVEAIVGAENDDQFCDICKGIGKKPTLVWCSDCKKRLCFDCQYVHGKRSKSHNISQISSIDDTTGSASRICTEHPGVDVNRICLDCDMVACQRCCMTRHQKCDSVVALGTVLPKLDSVLVKRTEDLQSEIMRGESVIATKQSHVQAVKVSSDVAETAIDDYSNKVIALVQEQQRQLKARLKDMTEDALEGLFFDINTVESELQMAQQNLLQVQEALKSPSDVDHYDMYKVVSMQEADREEHTLPTTEPVTAVKFEDNYLEVSSFLEKCFRNMKLMTSKRKSIDAMSEPVLITEINTKTERDSDDVHLQDIVVMTSGSAKTILVLDSRNKALKKFEYDGVFQNSYQFEKSPSNVTALTEDRAAVSVPFANQIAIFEVFPTMNKIDSITTSKQYISIACLSPTTIVAGKLLGFGVDIIDMSGTVLSSYGLGMFTTPSYIEVLRTNGILVSDLQAGCVKCVSNEGELRFTTGHYGQCSGVVSYGSDIFFVGGGSVKQLNEVGEFVRDVLTVDDGVNQPKCITFDNDSLMYVSADEAYVKVYKFT